jgi:hypothetical protein
MSLFIIFGLISKANCDTRTIGFTVEELVQILNSMSNGPAWVDANGGKIRISAPVFDKNSKGESHFSAKFNPYVTISGKLQAQTDQIESLYLIIDLNKQGDGSITIKDAGYAHGVISSIFLNYFPITRQNLKKRPKCIRRLLGK